MRRILNLAALFHVVGGVRLHSESKLAYLKRLLVTKKVIGTIIIILCATLVISHPEINPWYTNHEMEWDITIGSMLTYKITCTNSTPLDPTWSQYRMIPLNGTEVVLEVTYLPPIPRVVTSSNFQETVIDSTKVECSYKNGSSLPLEYSSHLNKLISGSLLPVNGSSLLDQLFLDYCGNSGRSDLSRPGAKGNYYYLQESIFNVTNLIVGYSSMKCYTMGHGCWGTSWFGDVLIQTGIPESGFLFSFVPQSCGAYLHEEIFLELVDVDYASE